MFVSYCGISISFPRYAHCAIINVDWGDGEQSQLLGAHAAEVLGDGGGFRTVSHTYKNTTYNNTAYNVNTTGGKLQRQAVYEIKIAGRLMAWSLRNPLSIKKTRKLSSKRRTATAENILPKPIDNLRKSLQRVLDLGDMGWVDLSHAFKDAINLVDVVRGFVSTSTVIHLQE